MLYVYVSGDAIQIIHNTAPASVITDAPNQHQAGVTGLHGLVRDRVYNDRRLSKYAVGGRSNIPNSPSEEHKLCVHAVVDVLKPAQHQVTLTWVTRCKVTMLSQYALDLWESQMCMARVGTHTY